MSDDPRRIRVSTDRQLAGAEPDGADSVRSIDARRESRVSPRDAVVVSRKRSLYVVVRRGRAPIQLHVTSAERRILQSRTPHHTPSEKDMKDGEKNDRANDRHHDAGALIRRIPSERAAQIPAE